MGIYSGLCSKQHDSDFCNPRAHAGVHGRIGREKCRAGRLFRFYFEFMQLCCAVHHAGAVSKGGRFYTSDVIFAGIYQPGHRVGYRHIYLFRGGVCSSRRYWGVLLILFMWIFVTVTYPESLIKKTRKKLDKEQSTQEDTETPWTQKIKSKKGWHKIAKQY